MYICIKGPVPVAGSAKKKKAQKDVKIHPKPPNTRSMTKRLGHKGYYLLMLYYI